MADRCDLTELIVDQCSHCNGKNQLPTGTTPGDLLIDRFFRARYDGRCMLDRAHAIGEGDNVGMAVYDNDQGRPPWEKFGVVCTECVAGIISAHQECCAD